MKKILVVLLLSVPHFSHAGMDHNGSPTLDPDAPQYIKKAQEIDSKNDDAGIVLLGEVLRYIKLEYYKNINFADCIPGLLKDGVSGCTDRYSFYLDPVQAKEENDTFTVGELAGIGATLELNKDGGIKILDVIEGSPAEKNGLQPNDIIIAVSSDAAASPDDFKKWTFVDKMPLDQTVKLIRGPKGTKINLLVVRGAERKNFLVTRDVVKIQFLKSKVLGEHIGYIRIVEFGGDVANQFYGAMQKFDAAGMQSVIIDLRNNGGGKLSSVLEMCSWFAGTKFRATILYVKERDKPLQDIPITGLSVGKFRNKHVVVLQNGNSASASEIFSGYLKSEANAVVIGENSFGKGIVQTLIPLSNKGELHLTISEYFIGSKIIKVHGIGIAPTIEVKTTKPAKTEADDEQLQRAILEAEKLNK